MLFDEKAKGLKRWRRHYRTKSKYKSLAEIDLVGHVQNPTRDKIPDIGGDLSIAKIKALYYRYKKRGNIAAFRPADFRFKSVCKKSKNKGPHNEH